MNYTRCKYAYKRCPEPRTLKRNGTLHNFCAHHRHKANVIQKKHISKRARALPDPVPFAEDFADLFPADALPVLSVLLELPDVLHAEPIAFSTFEVLTPATVDPEILALLIDL
ncbi:hypothetical protein ACHHYP_11817 [Achlya hypogyna]|uniref:Uncharacterized protein n=1 Tax=Achlya hypogyna TaxID=1202772 RepID=A0A1V9YIB1_ACHHY|nr:hypothetical protein ACHHYP_11817 [Achlya hypogyna]